MDHPKIGTFLWDQHYGIKPPKRWKVKSHEKFRHDSMFGEQLLKFLESTVKYRNNKAAYCVDYTKEENIVAICCYDFTIHLIILELESFL